MCSVGQNYTVTQDFPISYRQGKMTPFLTEIYLLCRFVRQGWGGREEGGGKQERVRERRGVERGREGEKQERAKGD